MLRDEDIERLRRLTPGDRARMGIEATQLAWRFLLQATPADRQRRLDRAREPWNPPRSVRQAGR
jgi:hypothetical protein